MYTYMNCIDFSNETYRNALVNHPFRLIHWWVILGIDSLSIWVWRRCTKTRCWGHGRFTVATPVLLLVLSAAAIPPLDEAIWSFPNRCIGADRNKGQVDKWSGLQHHSVSLLMLLVSECLMEEFWENVYLSCFKETRSIMW